MLVAESEAALPRFISARGVDPATSPVIDICRACLDFYAQVRAADIVPLSSDEVLTVRHLVEKA